MTDTVKPIKPRRSIRHKLALALVAMLLCGVFVVQPTAKAQAVWPVVGWVMSRAVAPAMSQIAPRLGFTAFTSPFRAVTVTQSGVTAHNIGQMALNLGGIALGLAPIGLLWNEAQQDQPFMEVGATEEDLEEIEEFAAAGMSPDGELPLYRATDRCWHEHTSISWSHPGTLGGMPEATVIAQHGATGSWPGKSAGTCATYGGSVQGVFVEISTGERVFGPSGTSSAIGVTDGFVRSMDWTVKGTGTFQQPRYWLEAVRIFTETDNQYSVPVNVTLPNPYAPDGTPIVSTPEGYYGVRECVPEGGGPSVMVTAEGVHGIPIPGACPPGHYSAGYGVYKGDPAAGGVELFAVGTPETWNLNPDGSRNYEQCTAPNGYSPNGSCMLAVSVDGRECAYGVVGCAGWMELVQNEPNRVTCYWGAYVMPYTDCGQLRHAYSTPDGVRVPQTISDDPDWATPGLPGEAPTPLPPAYPQPDPGPNPPPGPDGQPWPYPSPWDNPNPPPNTDPPGAGSIPLTGANPMPGQSTRPDYAQCLGGMWSWNPVDWVAVPILCTSIELFVPSTPLTGQVQTGIANTITGSAPGQMAAAIGGLMPQGPGAGCQGLPFDFDAFGIEFRGRLFESCSEPWAGVAAWTRGILSFVIVAGGALAAMRYGAAVFGFLGVGQTQPEAGGVRFK